MSTTKRHNFLPASFRFSPATTLVSIFLAALMFFAATWQWSRYKYKIALLETYNENAVSEVLPFPREDLTEDVLVPIVHRRVRLSGTYDYDNQVIVINRRHASGPGHWLLTPLKITNSDSTVIVSRGFIPFTDATPVDWKKYSFRNFEELDAVVQETVPRRTFLSPGSRKVVPGETRVNRFQYPDIEAIAEQIPYPIITSIYLQRLGPPPSGTFPAESIVFRVPPSTHFGYTIEWTLLGIATLGISFLLQAFPRKRMLADLGQAT